MKIKFSLPENASREGIINLKKFIEKASIDGVEGVEIDYSPNVSGQAGPGDILNSITSMIAASVQPLTELVICLQKFVDNYRTDITIPTPNGNIILRPGGRMKMTPAELEKMVTDILSTGKS